MKKILAISTNKKVISTVREACLKYSANFDAEVYSDT